MEEAKPDQQTPQEEDNPVLVEARENPPQPSHDDDGPAAMKMKSDLDKNISHTSEMNLYRLLQIFDAASIQEGIILGTEPEAIRLSTPEEINEARELLAAKDYSTLAALLGVPENEELLIELMQFAPDLTQPIPNYYDDEGHLDDEKLPAHLKGLQGNVEDISISPADFNRFIFEACIAPPGRDAFFTPDNTPGCVKNKLVRIVTVPHTPFRESLLPLSPADKEIFLQTINKYKKAGLIEPSAGGYAARAILVKKSSGRHQLAGNYIKINRVTPKNTYPLPLIKDNLDCLGRATYLSSLDICGAYFSLVIHPDDRDKLAFITHFGLYRWCRLPYGWINSGPEFNVSIDDSLINLKYQIVTNYADDILPFGGSSVSSHIMCVNLTFQRLQDTGFSISIAKCKIFAKQFVYLGYLVTMLSIQPTTKNVEKLLLMKVETVKDIYSFNGLCNYYRKFIKDYAKIAQPLYEHLKKGVGVGHQGLSEAAKASIGVLKKALSQYPILRHPDFTKRFILETDGSKEGLGSILLQYHGEDNTKPMRHVVAYASSGLTPAQRNYCAYQLECLAAVWAMQHFHHYLHGREFTLRTDNLVLEWMRRKNPPAMMARWILISLNYQYVVEHVPGRRHFGPDLMSRSGARGLKADEVLEKHEEIICCQFSEKSLADPSELPIAPDIPLTDLRDVPLEKKIWIQEQNKDPRIQRTLKNNPEYVEIKNGLFFYVQQRRSGPWKKTKPNSLYYFRQPRERALLMVPETLKPKLMDIAHGLFGHRGVKPIIHALRKYLYWPGLDKYVRRWVRGCDSCQRRKPCRPRRNGLMGCIAQMVPWGTLFIDFLGSYGPGLPETDKGDRHLLVVICGFTRYPIGIPLASKEVEDIVDGLMTYVFSVYGFPNRIHSDNDVMLINQVMQEIFKKLGLKHTRIVANNHNGNALVERMMRYLNASFTITLPKYKDWDKVLPLILFAYRTMVHDTTGFSPFYLLFGRDPILPLTFSWLSPDTSGENAPTYAEAQDYGHQLVSRLTEAFKHVRRLQNQRHERNAARADKKSCLVKFAVGDAVYFWEKAPSRHQGSGRTYTAEEIVALKKKGPSDRPEKWAFKWSGPHIIVKKHSDKQYTIKHEGKKKEVSIGVDRMHLFLPFSNDIQDTHPPPYVPERERNNPEVAPPPASAHPAEKAPDFPDKDELAIVFLRENPQQDMWVVKYLGQDQRGHHRVQWYGNSSFARVNQTSTMGGFAHVRDGAWYPGYINKQNMIVYRRGTMAVPSSYTIYDEEEPGDLKKANFMIWGFTLTPNHKVPKAVTDFVGDRLREIQDNRSQDIEDNEDEDSNMDAPR